VGRGGGKNIHLKGEESRRGREALGREVRASQRRGITSEQPARAIAEIKKGESPNNKKTENKYACKR